MVNNNNNNNNWLLWVVLIVAVIAVILSAIAISKANVTGQGIFDIFRQRTSTQTQTTTTTESRGLLADAYLASGKSAQDLKYYEAKYDESGELIYEILDDATYLRAGNNYEEVDLGAGGFFLKSKTTGVMVPVEKECLPKCPTDDVCTGTIHWCNTPITCKETGKKGRCRVQSSQGVD